MTRKQELKELENCVENGPCWIKNTYYSPEQAQEKLSTLEEKDNKSKAQFLIYNEGRQKELRRRIEAIAKMKRLEEEKRRLAAVEEAHKQAMTNLTVFAMEHNLE